MKCNIVSIGIQPCLARINVQRIEKYQMHMSVLNKFSRVLIVKSDVQCERSRLCRTPASLEEEFSAIQSNNFSKDEESDPETSREELQRPPTSEEALLADSQRSILLRKLSEANQQNRFLKRQLQVSEDALVNFKSELTCVELEVQSVQVMCSFDGWSQGEHL